MFKVVVYVMLCIFASTGYQAPVIETSTVIPHMPEIQSLNDIPEVNFECEDEYYNIDVHTQIDYIDETEKQIMDRIYWINNYGDENVTEFKAMLAEAENMRVYYTNLSTYTYAELRMLATTVAYEAGGCTKEHREYVAQVVINRCNDDRFPDNIYDVLIQPKQYSKKYVLKESAEYWQDKDTNVWNDSVDAAMAAMMGKVVMPENVIFQSQYEHLGTGIWKQFEVNFGSYKSTTYFNYG